MYDFESLVGELLQHRPELQREELMRRIEDKKRTVGAGYLTDQGALFLVAGELGVSLRKEGVSSDMTIKDLYVGANDVTVVARILAIYPEATFVRKDGESGRYRRLVLFDGSHQAKLTLWDEKVQEVEKAGIRVDSVVRVVSGYVKQGLDGKPTLNLGKRGRIELVEDRKVSSKLPPLSGVAEKLSGISQERPFVAIEAVVASEPRFSEFTRSDGSPGSLFQFGISSGEGKRETRVVIWSPATKPDLRRGQRVCVTNVRTKRSTGGEFEIHGDSGSDILQGLNMRRVALRVAAVSTGPSTLNVVGVDRGKNVVMLESKGGTPSIKVGDVLDVAAEFELDGKLQCQSPGSIIVETDSSFPSLQDLSTKLKDARTDDARVMVEVIALSHGSVDDVNLRDGSMVKKGELVIGDDTDEIKLVAWRELAGRVGGIQPGERLRIVGGIVKPMSPGTHVLELSNVTMIERIVGSA